MQYIFINPVVDKMYNKEELNDVLQKNGYERVDVTVDWHGIVKEKYKSALDEATLPLLDRRCPLAIEEAKKQIKDKTAEVPAIEPILIHCAMELATRETLKGKKKIITTPCESLASHGNQLQLQDTVFVSWKEFLKTLDANLVVKENALEESPIPLGYFDSLEAKTASLSGKETIEEYFSNERYKDKDLVEMLYCNGGCNNGDGVLIDET
ncbi:hypothetical protein [Anaerosporobacter sp.]